MQNSVLSSSTALNRSILRRCVPSALGLDDLVVKSVSDSSLAIRINKLLAINSNYYPLNQNLTNNNNKTPFPATKYYGNPMPSVGSIY
jgi:hypothetical protein